MTKLTMKDMDHVYYDNGKAYSVKSKYGGRYNPVYIWFRVPALDYEGSDDNPEI